MTNPEAVAALFHEAYERLAPSFGYDTRKASAVPWADVPEPNRSLMIAVAGEVLAALRQDTATDTEGLRAALARWLPPDVYQAGEFMRRNHRDITLSEYDADCALLAATEDRPDDPSFYGEEMDGFNMTERNADGSVVEP